MNLSVRYYCGTHNAEFVMDRLPTVALDQVETFNAREQPIPCECGKTHTLYVRVPVPVKCKHCGEPLQTHEANSAEEDFTNRTLQGFCAGHDWQDLTPSEQQYLIEAARRGAFRK